MNKQIEGDLRYAEQTYLELLRKYPDLSDTSHLLGLVRAVQERDEEAIELIVKAIRESPDCHLSSQYYRNL